MSNPTLSATDFKDLLTNDRPAAIRLLLRAWIEEWYQDGELDEITRVLSSWVEDSDDITKNGTPWLYLGSDVALAERYALLTNQDADNPV